MRSAASSVVLTGWVRGGYYKESAVVPRSIHDRTEALPVIGGAATAMDGLEIAEFLGTRATGVLSLADGNEAYGFPVSYAYDDDEKAVYVRLGFAPESQKRAFVDAAERASLVVYEETTSGWQSVVVEGTLSEVAPSQLESSLEEAVRGFRIPYFAVFRQPSNELEFELHRLKADSLTGVAEGR